MRLNGRLLWLFLFLTITFFLALPERGEAVDLGDRIRFEGAFEVLERDIETDNSVLRGPTFPDGIIFPKDIASAQSLRLLGKLSVRIVDAVEVFGLVGGSNLDIDDFNFRSDFSGAWGGGAELILYREDSPEAPYQVFLDYRFLTFEANDNIFFSPFVNELDEGRDLDGDGQVTDQTVTLTNQLVNEEIDWTEQLFRLGVRGRHAEFEPYGGIRFSFVRGKDHLPIQSQGLVQPQDLKVKFTQEDTFGVFVGTAYYLSPSERAAVFAELNLFDQFSLTGGVRVGF